jgi:hypothetical protein
MSDINNNIPPNRGVEIILTGGKRKQPKLFHLIFEKMICFLKREVIIYLEFSIKSRKVE